MNIEFDTVKIQFSMSEIYALKQSVCAGLEYTIKTHWVNHPDAFPDREHERLTILKNLCRITGDNYEYHFAELLKLIPKREPQ